jgi:hypothetical protein
LFLEGFVVPDPLRKEQMAFSPPSSHRKTFESVDKILGRTIQMRGAELLRRALERKTRGGPPEALALDRKAVVAALRRFRAQLPEVWENLLRETTHLKTRAGRAAVLKKALLEVLSTAGFSGGFLFGAQLPTVDFQLAEKDKETENVVIHAAALVASEVFLDWAQEILAAGLLAPTLSPSGRKWILTGNRLIESARTGLRLGYSARRAFTLWRALPVTPQRFLTDPKSLTRARAAIESLFRRP